MTMPASGREEFFGSALRPEQVLQLVNAIAAGGAFSSTLARVGSTAASVIFPVIDDVDEPEWTAELAQIPTLGLHGDPLVVAPTRLSGIVMISRESVDDSGLNLTNQVQEALRAKWSAVLDRDLLVGSGQGSVPAGLLPAAPAVPGESLWAAVVAAKAAIAGNGGRATHLAIAPDLIGAEEGRVDDIGRPIWQDGMDTYAGVAVAPTPAADPPMCYDGRRVHLIVRGDYEALLSQTYAPAFERYGIAMRLTVRMAGACPSPRMAMRRLVVGANGGRAAGTKHTAKA